MEDTNDDAKQEGPDGFSDVQLLLDDDENAKSFMASRRTLSRSSKENIPNYDKRDFSSSYSRKESERTHKDNKTPKQCIKDMRRRDLKLIIEFQLSKKRVDPLLRVRCNEGRRLTGSKIIFLVEISLSQKPPLIVFVFS